MASVEKVVTFITAAIAFTESELVFMRDLTQNPFKDDESVQERTIREELFLVFDDALRRK